jgi:hypothetical protein
MRRWGTIFAALCATTAVWVPGANATVFQPDAGDFTNGDATCTIREAIANANNESDIFPECNGAGAGDDTILLRPGTYQLSSTNNALAPGGTGALTIRSNGAGPVDIVGSGFDPIFEVNPSSDPVTVDGVTIRGGGVAGGSGGGINVAAGTTFTLTNSTLRDNHAGSAGSDGDGGGIAAFGEATVILRNNTITGNTATRDGGAIAMNSALNTLTMQNNTISGNTADSDNNEPEHTGNGGGVSSVAGTLNLASNIIAGNIDGSSGGGVSAPDCYGFNAATSVQNAGGNVLGNTAECGFAAHIQSSDVIGNPGLAPLASNGGTTQTMAIGPGSIALDRLPGACSAVSTDQRGLARPSGTGCDAGAFEYQVPPPAGNPRVIKPKKKCKKPKGKKKTKKALKKFKKCKKKAKRG